MLEGNLEEISKKSVEEKHKYADDQIRKALEPQVKKLSDIVARKQAQDALNQVAGFQAPQPVRK
jgi:hypothetical protein